MTAPWHPGTVTRCTDDVVDQLCAALEGGGADGKPLSLAQAVRRVVPPLHRSAVYDWEKRAAAGEQPFKDAIARIAEAREALKVDRIDAVLALARSGTKDDGVRLRATTWVLETFFPKEFGTRALEVTGKGGGAIQHEHAVDAAALADRIAALAAAGAAAGRAPDGPGDAEPGGAAGDRGGDDGG